jgi:tetratricopeptide (TPR) repeat protein
MKGDKPPYFTAAMYYLEHDRDLTKALGWFNKAAEQSPDAFWILHQKANCLARLGKKAEAIETAKQSIEKAKAAQNSDYVKLNEDLIRKLKG